jgi:hypothetical protein
MKNCYEIHVRQRSSCPTLSHTETHIYNVVAESPEEALEIVKSRAGSLLIEITEMWQEIPFNLI